MFYRTRLIIAVLIQIRIIFIQESACIDNQQILTEQPETEGTSSLVENVSLPLSTSQQESLNLENAINNHYEKTEISTKINSKVGNVDKNKINSLMEPKDALEKFIHILNRILQQLYNLYKSKFYSRTSSNLKDGSYIIIFDPEYLKKACEYIPRFLDYLYISNTPKTIGFFYLNKFHGTLCYRLLNFVKKNCKPHKIFTTEKKGVAVACKLETVNEVNSDILCYITRDDLPKDMTYQDTDSTFAEDAYNHVNTIDRTRLIDYARIMEFNIFQDVDKKLQNATIQTADPAAKSQIDNELLKTIDHNILNHNKDYFNKLTELTICDPALGVSDQDVKFNPNLSVVSKLLLYSFRRLEKHFKNNLDKHKLNDGEYKAISFNENQINSNFLYVFDDLCKSTPKILLYLAEHIVNIDVLSSLYLLYCGNLIDFIKSRCNNDGNNNFKVSCVIESLNDKFMWNLYTITKTIWKSDTYVKNDCNKEHNNYIKNIYEALNNFRHEVDYQVGLWTTYNWLSGKYFFTEDYDNAPVNRIKENIIYINGIPFTLSEIYYQFLPFNTKLETVLVFHNVILGNLDEIMNTYIYRHAFTIILYLEHKENNVDKDRKQTLQNSIDIYSKGKFKFYKYLQSLPVPFKSAENVQNVLEAIKFTSVLIDDGYSATKSIRDNIPPKILQESSKWAIPQLKGKTGTDYLNSLNKILINNCFNAIKIASIFIDIAVKSDVVRGIEMSTQVPFFTDELFCEEYLANTYTVRELTLPPT